MEKQIILKSCYKIQEELTYLTNYLKDTDDITLEDSKLLKNSLIGNLVLGYVPLVEKEQQVQELSNNQITEKSYGVYSSCGNVHYK